MTTERRPTESEGAIDKGGMVHLRRISGASAVHLRRDGYWAPRAPRLVPSCMPPRGVSDGPGAHEWVMATARGHTCVPPLADAPLINACATIGQEHCAD